LASEHIGDLTPILIIPDDFAKIIRHFEAISGLRDDRGFQLIYVDIPS
jgi:hypothetical protein